MAGVPHEIETLVDGAGEVEPEPEPTLGDLFAGRYRIERCIGRGSMGTVYAAHDRVVDERVALKLLATPSERALERFRQEVRLARRVTHRNTARTFDLAEHGGAHFITMELVEGESLRIRLATEPRMEVRPTLEIARQICHGLQAAHDVNVIHRDLKPANVLVEPSGRVVITDFGVACSTQRGPDAPTDPTPMAGTPAYMAPEQVMKLPLDGRADIYALGVMLYEMLTGRPAWPGGNRVEVAMARMHRPPPDPREHVALTDGLAHLVLRCLARDPQQRPATPAVLADQIAGVLDGTTPPVPLETLSVASTMSSLFAPTQLGDRALAVMPFRYQGVADDAYLVDALTDELVDVLSMTRGLRVSASGATSRFRDERDARTVGRALGVDAIIDGTLRRIGDQVRIVARLIDVETGFQKWSERFTGRLEDVFEFQDRMAKRVAEALRVELALHPLAEVASAEAVEHYLRGRSLARRGDAEDDALEEATAHFGQAQALAPAFVLPLAARADAVVRRWFIARGDEGARRAEAAREAVDEALDRAGGLAETHLAAARLEVNRGAFDQAAHHLTTALKIAPTYAAAHEYLGMLQCDAGRSREGVRHIRLAHELDPTLGIGTLAVLRHYALHGNDRAYEKMLGQLRRSASAPRLGLDLFEFRAALWRNDEERARSVRWPAGGPAHPVVSALESALDPQISDEELGQRLEAAAGGFSSPRLRTAWRQISVEVLAWRGALDDALATLTLADAESVLLDADWLESCSVLTPMRHHPEFVVIRDRVRRRANEIWQVDGAV